MAIRVYIHDAMRVLLVGWMGGFMSAHTSAGETRTGNRRMNERLRRRSGGRREGHIDALHERAHRPGGNADTVAVSTTLFPPMVYSTRILSIRGFCTGKEGNMRVSSSPEGLFHFGAMCVPGRGGCSGG